MSRYHRLTAHLSVRLTVRWFLGLALLIGMLAAALAPVRAQPPVPDVVPDQRAAQIEQDFLMGMIPHHRGAITMSRMALEKATKQELRAFAQKVIDAQSMEIEQLREWLRTWYGIPRPWYNANGGRID